MIRVLSLVRLLVSVSAMTPPQKQPLMRRQVEDELTLEMVADGHTRGDHAEPLTKPSHLESWDARHPQLPAPYFWFLGGIAEVLPGAGLLQTDPLALVLQPPSSKPQELETPNQDSYSQWKQDIILRPILNKVQNGFFVESGALDGELHSNTLSYELHDGWTGLLIEPDPESFDAMTLKHRHAYAYNGCLSPSGRAETLLFNADDGEEVAHISDTGSYTVQCQPLHALMEAIGRTTVDFWSLDIEGSESAVLHSTDFSKVEVGVLLIEMNKGGANNHGIREVMRREGFHVIGHSTYYYDMGPPGVLDRIFINPSYFKKRNLDVPVPDVLDARWRN